MKKFVLFSFLICLGFLSGCANTNSANNNNGGGGGAVLKSIAITPSPSSVAAGLTVQLKATGTYSDSSTQDLTNSATWSSSSTSAASISSSGLVTGKAAGTTTITATSGSVSGTLSLTVNPPNITSLTVSPATAQIAATTTQQFKANANFSDGTSGDATGLVQWTSSNTSVASINLNGAPGLAKGLAKGTSTITATSGSVSSTGALTVTNATLTSIAVTPTNASIPLGSVQQFTATGTFSDGTTQDITGTATWTSSNTNLVSITVSGLATGKDLGSVTITASSGSVQNSVTASVNAADLSSLAITPTDVTLAETTSQEFTATGTFSDGGTRNLTSQVTWASSDTTVASVGSGTGVAKGLSPGTTTISAALGSVNTSTTLDVTNATLTKISVTPAGSTIAPGTQLAFTATGTFSDGSTQNITLNVTWVSNATSVATIGTAGVATGVASGTANISATLNGVTGSAALNVSSVTLKSIAVSPSTSVLAPTATSQYSAVGTFSDGSTQTITGTVTWSSSLPSVASISSFGLVTGQSAGQATITAQQESVSGTASLVVESSALTSITVNPAAAQVAEQTGTQFQAIGGFADGSTENLTTSVQWSSTPLSTATVSDASPTKGLATGVAPGSATITALFAGQSGSATLTVTNAKLTSITVTPSDSSVSAGSSVQFTATGSFSDGTTEDLTTQVTWTSSEVSVVTVNSSGLGTTAASGSSTITAKMNGVSGSTTLTVQ